MFSAIAITPPLVLVFLLVVLALKAGEHYWVFGFAIMGCLLSAAAPWFCLWYTWNVLNDHTANIGAGLLALGQPLIAPVAAVVGALLGLVVEVAFKRGDN